MKFRILLLFCLLSSSLCPAKERQLIFRSFNADNGLAHNTVLAVIQDRTGFMWFGTKDGLNRYDGSEIRTVAVTDAIPGNNYISALCEDNKGCIWIGTDSGVCLYDPETERANRFLLKADDGSRITENIPQIVLAPDSTVWIAAGSQGFFRYDSGAKTLTRIPGDKTGRKTYSARNICFTAQNAICITLDDGNIYLSEDQSGKRHAALSRRRRNGSVPQPIHQSSRVRSVQQNVRLHISGAVRNKSRRETIPAKSTCRTATITSATCSS